MPPLASSGTTAVLVCSSLHGVPLPSTVHVSADDLDAALEDLLDTRNRMTRRALGLDEETV